MSDLTPTCEEYLVDLFRELPDDHYILILPVTELLMDVFVVPLSESDNFMYMDKHERHQYWKTSWGGLGIHKDVWQNGPHTSLASRYR